MTSINGSVALVAGGSRGIGKALVEHVGYVDTDLTAGVDAPKTTPDSVATQALDGIEANALEVIADDLTRQVKAGLAADPTALYPQLTTGK